MRSRTSHTQRVGSRHKREYLDQVFELKPLSEEESESEVRFVIAFGSPEFSFGQRAPIESQLGQVSPQNSALYLPAA